VNRRVERNYLEINSIRDLKEPTIIPKNCTVQIVKSGDFQINKFFYKNIGKKHNWVDRLVWTEQQWIKYTSDKKVKTFVLKIKDDFAGYYELIFHKDKNEVEIAYLGLLEEYQNRSIGSYLLSTAIKNSFLKKSKRVWVHTCSLDHRNALKNYKARGMKVFKKEFISI
tara:strand:- start:161 stop:664 length:504 start_codon:yes stop_codon:yes gene_type:complete